MIEVAVRSALLATLLVVSSNGLALAQPLGPPTSRTVVRAVQLPDAQVARLSVTWAASEALCSAELTIPDNAPTTLRRGTAAGTLVAGHGVLLVAYGVVDPRNPFFVRLARRAGERYELGPPTPIARPGQRSDVPFAVVATPVPDGFAVFFQEVEEADPTAAHTYLVRTDPQGAPRGPAREVNVPWSLADAAWNGSGFHLALIYPGGGTGMRLSMVSLTEDATPQQHPDWSSRAGYIDDVHLASSNGRIVAFYRGGAGGDRLLESDVTQIRSWGSDPPAGRDHGALAQDALIVVDSRGGTVQPRRVSLR